MINYQDIRPLKIYTTKFNLILNKEDKLKNTAVFLLTPNYKSTLSLINSRYIINRRYIMGYYFEPGVNYYLTESNLYDLYNRYDILYELAESNDYDYTFINEIAEKDLPTGSTGPTNFRNPTKPRVKSRMVDGKKIVPNKKTANPLRDPKSLMRHLRYDMRRPKYKLNKLTKDRANIGGDVNDPEALEKNKKLMDKGKRREIARKNTIAHFERLKKEKEEAEKENGENLKESSMRFTGNEDDVKITEDYIQTGNFVYLNEGGVNTNSIRKIIYNDRIKRAGDITKIYRQIKIDTNKRIKYCYKTIDAYNHKNIFYDLSYYNEVYFRNSNLVGLRAYNVYLEFLNRQINNKSIIEAGYDHRVTFIPVNDWVKTIDDLDFSKSINPISIIVRALRRKKFSDISLFDSPIIFFSDNGYFKVDKSDKKIEPNRIINLLNKLVRGIKPDDPDVETIESSPEGLATDIITDIEDKTGISIATTKKTNTKPEPITPKKVIPKSTTTKSKPKETKSEIEKKEVENNISNKSKEINTLITKVAKDSKAKTKEELADAIDNSEELDNIMTNIKQLDDMQSDGRVKTSAARSRRMNTMNKDYVNLTIGNRTVGELLKDEEEIKDLQTKEVDVDSPNEGWKHLKFANFEKAYDLDGDIAAILKSFTTNKHYPVSIRDIKVEDTSTSQDYVKTYTVSIEDDEGKRSSLVFDMPILLSDKFMVLKGNKKTMQKQIAPIPVCKIDPNASQISTNYMKVTVSPFGADGKSFKMTETLIKILTSKKFKNIEIESGSCRNYYNKHIRPMDFLDMSSYIRHITIKDFDGIETVISFDLKDLISKFPEYNLDEEDSYIVGYRKLGNKLEPLYVSYSDIFSKFLFNLLLNADSEFNNIYKSTINRSSVSKYSRAKILQAKIPIVILTCFYEGLSKTLYKASIEYSMDAQKRNDLDYDSIKFKDGYLNYKLTYESSLLMNGLYLINPKEYTLAQADTREPYLKYLNDAGLGNKVDGLLNFYDLMMDPLTVYCCKKYKVPADFVSLLIYASNLLADNKYLSHTDMNGRRVRSMEIISGYLYLALAKAYQEYANARRRGRNMGFTIKKSAVIDAIMLDPTFSDMPLLNDLQIFEAGNAVSYKGLSGMNNDRAYSLDKRVYDTSMLNIIGMATSFAGNVGINRQLTIDPNVVSQKGFTATTDDAKVDKSLTKTFTMTEAIAPYGVTRNDPMRSAMNFIQTSNHSMRVAKGSPSLVTTGADQALPYLSDNTFSYKAKLHGVVKEVTDSYILVEYADKTKDMIDIRPQILKNSNGGFYCSTQLTPTVKKGQKFGEGKILAYDKLMYSSNIGDGKNISYKLGTLAKVAILNTNEGYEDSAIICEKLSEQMASDIVELKTVTLGALTNVLNIVNIGDPIQEGDPLIVFQDMGDEEYYAQLMATLSGDKDKLGVGKIPVKSNITGIVKDIKVYRTVELKELSPSLRKCVSKLESGNKAMEKVAKENNIHDSYKYHTEVLKPEGKLKKAADSVVFEFYLQYHDKMGTADKLIYQDAVKGVSQKIIPAGLEPRSQYRPEEIVESLVAKGSLDARMVTSIKIVGGINKALIELDRSIKEELGIKWKTIDELVDSE